MPTNENDGGLPVEIHALDQAIREVAAGISVAEATTQRLVEAAFSNAERANAGIYNIMKSTGDVEEVIRAIQGNAAKRSWHFGQTQNGILFFGKRHAARVALAELPDALRKLQELCNKQHDLINGRKIHIMHRVPTQADVQHFTWAQKLKRSMGHRM